MSRTGLFAGILLLGLLAAQPTQAAWYCYFPPSVDPDCGSFPEDNDIMVIQPGKQAVVARFWPQGGHFSHVPYTGQKSPVRGIRVYNNLEHPLPIFLRTRKEFDAFLEFAEREPGISTCQVVDGTWYHYGCADENDQIIDCPTEYGLHIVRRILLCHDINWECGGRCFGKQGRKTQWIYQSVIENLGRTRKLSTSPP